MNNLKRERTIDVLRGFIMILMAIDHCFLTIYKTHFAETWNLPLPNYGTNSIFITRWLSNICAPGFALLMGVSIRLFMLKNVDNQSITSNLIKRGFVLIILQQLLNLPSLFFDLKNIENIHLFTGGVLYSLGFSMILCAFAIKWNKRDQIILGTAIICLNYVIANNTVHLNNTFMHLLFTPGVNQWVSVNYPVFPWLGVSIIGLGLGGYLIQDRNQFFDRIWKIGAVLVGSFMLIRLIHWGDFNHLPDTNSLINFLAIIKYPPSIAFLLITLGILFILMTLMDKLISKNLLSGLTKPLLVFGKVPLFFYFTHYYLYIIISKGTNHHISLSTMYLLWLVGLIILYPICIQYQQFKSKKATNSFWRFL